MLPAKTFCAALQFVRHASAVKDVRYYLKGVFLEFRAPNLLTVVGLDGHRMAVVELQTDEHELDASFLVASEDVVKILALYKKSPGTVTFYAAEKGALGVVSGDSLATFPVIDGKFPEWRRVLPAGEPTATPGFWNPDYLADLTMAAASLQKGARPYPGVEVRHYASDGGRAGRLAVRVLRTAHLEIVDASGYVMGINP